MTNTPEFYYVGLHITTSLSPSSLAAQANTNTNSNSNSSNGNFLISPDHNEITEIAWNIVSGTDFQSVFSDSVSIKPVKSINMAPTTTGEWVDALAMNIPSAASASTIADSTQESSAVDLVSFKDAITQIDNSIQTYILSKSADFIFITYDAWDLRVVLPREARDLNVVLPAYLQHSKCFALKNEYLKWQVHHPETLSYSVGNLGNVLTALEVELDYPFNYGNVGVLHKTALQEVQILTKLLIQMIKKSKPSEEHPDVLTRPFDSKLDIRCFLSERSKVLHLSNLPYDTTQSELESWFTSYGGRPIAFWTLKTPEQHKPTGKGFVVFSTHEEAAEALGMNGRYLNDSAIEIQPSSARILDRAQEILTAFPQSKNRPRPGDWNCPSCGFSNFQRRTACFRCSFPASTAVAIQEQSQPNFNSNNNANLNQQHQGSQQIPQQQQQQHVPQQQQQQQQQMSQHQNINQNQNQNQNQNINHNQNQNSNNNNNGNKKHNMNHMHNNNNNSNNNQSQSSNNQSHNNNNNQNQNQNNNNSNNNRSVPFRAGDWKCPLETCQYHNFAKNVSCLRCGGSRVGGNSNNNNNSSSPSNSNSNNSQINNNNNGEFVQNAGLSQQQQLHLQQQQF